LMQLAEPAAFSRMRAVAWRNRRSATWQASTTQLERILGGLLPPAVSI